MSICFQKINVNCQSTHDSKGQQRFIAMDPNYVAIYKGGEKQYSSKMYKLWGEQTGSFKYGSGLVSEEAIGFHNLRYPEFMKRIYALLYSNENVCPKDSLLTTSFESLLKDDDD